MINMIFLTGDTHLHEIQTRFNFNNFPTGRELTKEDYIIICGDFGVWSGDTNQEEKYIFDWLNDRPWTTLFVSGNHENYDILDNLSIKEWHGGKVNFIRDSIIHLRRGEIFEIEGKNFFAFGGASSHDIQHGIIDPADYANRHDMIKACKALDKKYGGWQYAMYRIKGESWWEQELPTQEEMNWGLRNIELHDNKVDYIITHSPSTSELLLGFNYGFVEQDILTKYIDEVKSKVDYKKHYFGHMHDDIAINDKDICLYRKFDYIR